MCIGGVYMKVWGGSGGEVERRGEEKGRKETKGWGGEDSREKKHFSSKAASADGTTWMW